MLWREWWPLLCALHAALAQPSPTVCHDESCHCDSFTRLICNCTRDVDEVTLRPDGAYRVPSAVTGIIINGCARVYFLQDTVKGLQQLRNIALTNVKHIYFMERSLAWSPYAREFELSSPGLRIAIRNSTINEISSHAITGRVDDISIRDSRVHVIKPFAFSSLTGIKNIELINNIYDNIEIQAFKKFTTVNFLLRGGKTQNLPSRLLSDIEITNRFIFENMQVRHMSSLTFLVNGPKRVSVENNYIEDFDGDSFHITCRGPVSLRNNTIRNLQKGALLGFTVDREVTSTFGLQELLLDNNTVTYMSSAALAYDKASFALRVAGLSLNTSCTCELAEQWRDVLAEQGGSLACWYGLEDNFISIPSYVESRCGALKQNFWIFIVVGIVFIIFIGVVIAFFVIKRESDKKKKVQIVMPDGKTYRETEFHIVVERAELLTTDL